MWPPRISYLEPQGKLKSFSLSFKFVCSLSNKLNGDSDENDISWHFMKQPILTHWSIA